MCLLELIGQKVYNCIKIINLLNKFKNVSFVDFMSTSRILVTIEVWNCSIFVRKCMAIDTKRSVPIVFSERGDGKTSAETCMIWQDFCLLWGI